MERERKKKKKRGRDEKRRRGREIEIIFRLWVIVVCNFLEFLRRIRFLSVIFCMDFSSNLKIIVNRVIEV